MLADCWLVGCLVFLNSKSRLKWLTCLDWLHGWRLPSLLSWSVVGWLVLAKRLTECGWLLVGGWLGALWRQNRDSNDWLVLTDCMAGGSPLCLAGRWLVDWFWQRDWQNVADCWLVGCLVFLNSKSRLKWLTCLDQWLHCWRLPSLLSWSVVGWLVFGKKTDRMWLTVGWWVAWCFVTSKSRLKWLTCLDWLHGWRLPSLLSWSVVGWLVLAKRLT